MSESQKVLSEYAISYGEGHIITGKELAENPAVLDSPELEGETFKVSYGTWELGTMNLDAIRKDLDLMTENAHLIESEELFAELVQWIGEIPDLDAFAVFDLEDYAGSGDLIRDAVTVLIEEGYMEDEGLLPRDAYNNWLASQADYCGILLERWLII